MQTVRRYHIHSSRRGELHRVGSVLYKDIAYTQLAMETYLLECPHIVGVNANREDLAACFHFWRVIGHMIGINDRFNGCTDDWDIDRERCKYCFRDVFTPQIRNANVEFYQLARAYIDGFWGFTPIMDSAAVIYWMKYVHKFPGYLYFDSDERVIDEGFDESRKNITAMNWFSRFVLFFLIITGVFLNNFQFFRKIFRIIFLITRKVNNVLPIFAIYAYGWRSAFVRMDNKITQ